MRKLKLFSLFLCLFIGIGQMLSATIPFTETFVNCTGTNNDFGTSTSSDGNGTFSADNSWTTANPYGANGAAKFGASKKSGSATTPSLTVSSGSSYTLSFNAAPWANESTTMTVTVTGGTINSSSTATTSTMTTGQWNHYEYTIVASSTSMTIAFSASKNRFFLDEVSITANGSGPEQPTYSVTPEVNHSGWGTATLDGSVITAEPANGYRYASPAFTVEPSGKATVSQGTGENINEFTVSDLSDNVTVTINFEAIPTHTVTWSQNGNTETTSTVAEGAAIIFPSSASGCDGKEFKGWVASPMNGESDTEPTYVTSATMGTNDVTYYAVFAKANTTSGSDQTITLTYSSFGSWSGYSEKSCTVGGKSFTVSKGYPGANSSLQMNSNTSGSPGKLYNTTAIAGLKSIKLTAAGAGKTVTVYQGAESGAETTEKGTAAMAANTDYTIDLDNTSEYFTVKVSGATYFASIVITYSSSTTTYSKYSTSCAAPTSPTINTEPVGADYITGATATALTVEATASAGSLSYQWYTCDANGDNAAVIEGATNASYAPSTASAGTAYYYCAVSDEGGGDATLTTIVAVVVTDPILVESISIKESTSILIGNTETLVATITPDNATDKSVTWSSNNESVATVDENGVVTAVAAGTATITAAANGGTEKSATCEVTVTAPLPTITITQDQIAGFTNKYDEYEWTANNISGKIYAYKNSGMQLNDEKDGHYVYNTTPIPGNITKITMTKASGTDRSWTPYVSASAMTSATGTALTAQTVGTSGTTWDVTGSNQYFYLDISGGSTVIGSIVITYEPIISAVTVDDKIAHGSVAVSGAEDLTAVAAGTELTLTNTPSDEYQLKEYNVYKTGDAETKITVVNNKFIMPLYGVTVSAEFEESKELDHLVITSEASQKTFWVGEDFNYDGLTIKAVYDNDTEKENVTPKSVSTPDMTTAGGKTVTIAYEEKGTEKTITYDITVKAHPTDPTKPCTVVEALDYLDKFDDLEDAYVTGKVSKITEVFNSTYGNISYNISDDGETSSPQLLVYRGKDFNGNNFPNADAIQVGDSVVVKGKIFTYETTDTKEFAQNNQIVYRPRKVVSIALSEGYKTEFNDNEEFSHEGVTVTATYNYGDDEPVTATWSEPVMTQLGEQEVTVSYTYEGKTVEFKYTITITHVCAPENLVAVTKGEEDNTKGTYTVVEENVCTEGDGATVDVTDIVPAEGYRFAGVTSIATGGTDEVGTVVITETDTTVTGIKAATTITVVFEEIPTRTINYSIGGAASSTTAKEGTSILAALPENPTPCDAINYPTFYGWKAGTAIEGLVDDAPEILNNEALVTASTPDVTYYAVFTNSSSTDLFTWNGGSSADLKAKTGVTTNGLGSDYAASNTPYLVKLDGTGDYIIIDVASQPAQVAVDVKMLGGASDSKITVQQAANKDSEFSDVEDLTISGTQGAELTLTTTQAFAATTRAIKLYFTKGSNVGVGPIHIEGVAVAAKYMTTCCTKRAITIDANIANGTVEADLELACENDEVTLSPTAVGPYHFDAWDVYVTNSDPKEVVTVTNNKFIMPAAAVTVSATFVHDDCTALATPANVEVVADYKSAMLDWDDVTDADHYVVTIKKGEETVESNTVDASEYEVEATLLANTTYTYEIQATADDALTHCPSALATENFNTEALPNYTLTLMENGVERAEDAEYTKTHAHGVEFNLPASSTSACTGKVFVGWSNKQGDLEATDLISNPVSLTQNTTFYAVYATEGAGQATTLFSETFDACSGKGANDANGWSGNIASDNLPNSLTGWTFVSGKAAYQCAKFGTGSAKGSAQTPTIEVTGAATLTFKAGAWNGGSEGTTLNLSAAGADLDKSSVEMTKGAWSTYTVAITNANGSVKIKFEAKNASNNRFFLDDVVVSQSAIVYTDYTTSCAAALAEPTFTPAAGAYAEAQTITISGPDGATIYYTTDGSEPTTESAVYGEAITINKCGETTIKAFAKNGDSESAVAEATYTLNLPMPENSQAAPYTPTQAIAVYDGNGYCYDGETMVYVKGVVKTSSGLNSQYGNYDNIVVVAEETTSPEFTFFHMYKGSNKVHFEEGDVAIEANDTIEAYGKIVYYSNGDIYEFADGCYLIGEVKKYSQPKTSIVNDPEHPYTIAQAIGFIDEPATYDLSDSVWVKAVANAAPTNAGTFTAHDADVENSFQFFNTKLDENTIVANDTVIVKGIIKKVNTTYRMDAGRVVEVKGYVAPVVPMFTVNPATAAFGNVEKGATVDPIEITVVLTAIQNATVTLADDNNVFSIDVTSLTENGIITVTANTDVDIAEYAATITLHDEAAAAEDVEISVSMNVTEAETRKVATITSFSSVSGDLNPSDITYAGYQGGAQNAPNASNKDNELRLYKYQTSTDFGGYVTIKAKTGCTIDQVVITVGGNANVGFSKNDAAIPTKESTPISLSTSDPFDSGTGLDADSIRVVNIDESNQFKIKTITVYYTGAPLSVDHYILGGEYATEFEQYGTFSYEGLTVTAAYDAEETITEPVSGFTVEADLMTAGAKKAEVYLGETKITEYDITVTESQKKNPNLAYTPSEQTIAAAEVASWEAPVFSNALNVSPITFTSSKEAVATVDENGVIALAGGYGTATITATFAETEQYIASEATYTITVQEPVENLNGNWVVAEQADLIAGTRIIIASSTDNKTMGAQASNNRSAVASTVSGGVLTPGTGTKLFRLVDAENGNFAIQANNGNYLYAASNSSNHLKEEASIDANGNATWDISIANGIATIKAQGTNANNWVRYNTSGLFSCYGEVNQQKDVVIYVNKKVVTENETITDASKISEDEDIIADGNVVVTISAEITANSITAKNGATVVVNQPTEAKSVVVEDGSKIVANAATTTPTVYFSTTMGSTQVPGTASELGSVENITLATGGEIIYDLTLGTSLAGIQADPNQWHAFTLPFAVSATEGIYDAETGAKLYNEVNYAIMDYHGDIRANGDYGWKKYRGILQPGVFYLMTVDGNTKTFRFKASKVGEMTQTTSMSVTAFNGSGESSDYGWNGIGNPAWVSGIVDVSVQVLDPYTYTYQTLTSGTNLTVSTPFFYNAGGSGAESSIVMQDAGTGANYAPARTQANEIKNVSVSFGNEVFRDKIYISASEDALNTYEQDKDLVRMIMSSTPKVAQIFGNAYGMKLSMVNAPMVNDQATYGLTLYAPQAGEYTISAPEMENADIYLTYEGSIIWNLSMGEYTSDFEKGNNEGYGLLLVKKAPQVTTGVDNAEANETGVQKVIINEHVYILRAEQMYDVTGKLVK